LFTLVGLFGLSWAVTAALDMPNPVLLVRFVLTPRSEVGALFPARLVAASPQPRPLPRQDRPWPAELPWKGRTIPLEAFLETTRTNALLMVRRGVLVGEWYRPGEGPKTMQSSWSVAKSVVSLLVGQAIGAGRLSEADRLVDLLPAFHAAGADPRITVRDLLDMTSGVDVAENYSPWRPFAGTAGLYLTRSLVEFARSHSEIAFAPGSHGDYRSIDTELLGLVLAKIEGRPLADLLAERVWAPIGAEHIATWNLDRENGTEKAFCCINATARDFAKLGQLVLDGGRVGAAQVVPPAWIERLTQPAAKLVDGLEYSAQWWHVAGPDDDLAAIGVYGQYIYVNRDRDIVIVKLSDYGAEQDEAETLAALRALANSE
jgi:CubicO group peptidase (beta-lactamase class C family)